MNALAQQIDSSDEEMQRDRYLGMLDVSVFLITLAVFLLFLVLLVRIVFPQGSRLGDTLPTGHSTVTDTRGSGSVSLAGDNVSSFSRFKAYLGDVRRDVKIRSADSIAWSNAVRGSSVSDRDAVQTFSRSRARVDFTRDNELQIGQNSLVVFRQGASDPFLNRREAAVVVLEGELTGSVNADYGAFAVELPAGLIELSADEGTDETVEFRLGVNADKSSTIAIYSGHADINVAGEHYRITANQGITISADGTTVGTIALPTLPAIHAPANNAVARFLDAPPDVDFRWGGVVSAEKYRVEISTDPRFDEVIVDDYFDETSFRHGNLASGEYYWRVSAGVAGLLGPASAPRRLQVARDAEPPRLELQSIEQLIAGNYVLRGKTSSGAKVYVLGAPVEPTSDGFFEHVFNPESGTQTIVVESIDAVGNVAYKSQILHVPGSFGRSD